MVGATPMAPPAAVELPLAPILCSRANRLPGATFPMLDCHKAAREPATTRPETNPALVNPVTTLQEALAAVELPLAPILCSQANQLPGGTFPMLDCHKAAGEPATTPPGLKPIAFTPATNNDDRLSGMTIYRHSVPPPKPSSNSLPVKYSKVVRGWMSGSINMWVHVVLFPGRAYPFCYTKGTFASMYCQCKSKRVGAWEVPFFDLKKLFG